MKSDLENRLQAALDACAKMQEQRDQLAAQLKDATAQCVVSAELFRELRDGAEIHLHNCTVCKNEEGIDNWTSKLERIDAAMAGKLPSGPSASPLIDRINLLTFLLRELRDGVEGEWCFPDNLDERIDAVLAGKVLTAGVDVTDGRFEIEIAGWSAHSETILTAPARIWLQVGDQGHYHSEPFHSDTGEVTWCADSVVGCEVPYVRADLVSQFPVVTMRGCSVGKTTSITTVPEGWQLVPVKPTEEMITASVMKRMGASSMEELDCNAGVWAARDCLAYYLAMLAAAPKSEGAA